MMYLSDYKFLSYYANDVVTCLLYLLICYIFQNKVNVLTIFCAETTYLIQKSKKVIPAVKETNSLDNFYI